MTQEHNTNTGDSPTRDMPPPDHTVIIEVPRELGPYRLSKLLGRGGMGEVWQALDTSLEREVAIKLMRKELSSNEDATRRFAREARAVARLNHPNIVQVYAFGDEKGLNYFIMELVEGETVSQCLKRRKQIPLEDALHTMLQAVEGLSYANARGIIHRDIKPSNLMLTDDNRVKIADFGLAKMVEHDTQMTAAGTAMGSPNYMSPEQARGEEADHRSDIYALGVSLYQMLCGDLPFTANSPVSVLLKQIQEPLPEHEIIKCLHDGRVLAVLKKMTEKNPAERYQSYGELSQALSELQPNLKFKSAHLATSSMPAATPASGTDPKPIPSTPPDPTPSAHFAPPPPPSHTPSPGGTAVVSSRELRTPPPADPARRSSRKGFLLAIATSILMLIFGLLAWATLKSQDTDSDTATAAAAAPPPADTQPAEATPQPTTTAPTIAPTPSPATSPATPTPAATSSMEPADITIVITPAVTPPPGDPLTVTPRPDITALAPSSGRLLLGSETATAGSPIDIFDSNGTIIATAPAGTPAALIRPLTLRGERWLAIRYNNNEGFIPEGQARRDSATMLQATPVAPPPRPSPSTSTNAPAPSINNYPPEPN